VVSKVRRKAQNSLSGIESKILFATRLSSRLFALLMERTVPFGVPQITLFIGFPAGSKSWRRFLILTGVLKRCSAHRLPGDFRDNLLRPLIKTKYSAGSADANCVIRLQRRPSR